MSSSSSYAKGIAPKDRKEIIAALTEQEFRLALIELFQRMMPDATPHHTHGSNEYGKDIVITSPEPYGSQVFAVVVKTGKITGEAKGKIDEIVSQTRSALKISAEVPDVISSLQVDQVWVVMSGKIFPNARKKIENEFPDTKIRFFDAEMLDKNFVEHFPEVYFHGNLLTFLDETSVGLDTNHLALAGSTTKLTDVFVDPILMQTKDDYQTDDYDYKELMSGKKMGLNKLDVSSKQRRKILIVGEPGVGKSASLKKLTIDGLHRAAADSLKNKGLAVLSFPIFVPAVIMKDINSVEELIKRTIPESIPDEKYKISAIHIDGLDEAPREQHSQIISNADIFAEQLGASLILTSRNNVGSLAVTPEGFTKYEMLPFEVGQAVQFFEQMVKNENILQELKNALSEVNRNLALTPLSLLLLVQIAEDADEIPATIGELYDRFTDEVLGKNDIKKGIEVLFDYQIRKRLLASLAFREFYKKNRTEIPRGDFDTFIDTHFSKYAYDVTRKDEFVSCLERSEIITIGNSVKFKHRSFLDYFCALYVMQEPEKIEEPIPEWAAKTYYDDNWSDIIFFYFGHRREIPQDTMRALIGYSGDTSDFAAIKKFLFGRLLQAGWHTPLPLRIEGIKSAIAETSSIKENFKTFAESHGNPIPDIATDGAIIMLAERSFRSSVLVKPCIELLNETPDADSTEGEWISYMAILAALRNLLDEDTLLTYAAEVEKNIKEVRNPALRARVTFINMWTLQEHPKERKSLEKKFNTMLRKYNQAVRGAFLSPKQNRSLK